MKLTRHSNFPALSKTRKIRRKKTFCPFCGEMTFSDDMDFCTECELKK